MRDARRVRLNFFALQGIGGPMRPSAVLGAFRLGTRTVTGLLIHLARHFDKDGSFVSLSVMQSVLV